MTDRQRLYVCTWIFVMSWSVSLGKPLRDEYLLNSYDELSGSGSSLLTSKQLGSKTTKPVAFLSEEQYIHKKQSLKPFFEFLSYYKRKVYPDKLDKQLVEALENHIEEIEPQFRSGSFSQLWNALRVPLTDFFRPRSSSFLVEELDKCLHGNTTRFNRSKLSDSVENIRRDLIICKIAQILDGRRSRPSLKELWGLLRGPMTPLLIADLRTMVRELAQYASRFEMAGILYQLPGKMSDIRRDVVICKVDDVFNAVYDTNFKELERDL
ncbi:uncharacterized protein LOC110248176 [Exaiptasia diaphana]|uniref:Uncharacterized protein n=1 Tax=Exaiptasia diaphana TaxID=2652724 RepID=A0A913XU64_EXADI|nr:uncharacterized protein LOC110248176 [Exaiptasia diaphana]KXJ28437.1 hypothetical protein AC249_AIPGENE23303 [Exaiptasia diaphana]